MIAKSILNIFEGISKEDMASLYRALEEHPDDFVHFSNMEYVSINPKQEYAFGGNGVYAYPVFLVKSLMDSSKNQYISSVMKNCQGDCGPLHASDRSFFHIISVDFSNYNILRLSEIEEGDIEKYKKYATHSIVKKIDMFAFDFLAAKFLYLLKGDSNTGKNVSKALYREFDGLYDDFGFIISSDIKYQIVLYNRKCYDVLYTGRNKVSPHNSFLAVVNTLMKDYGFIEKRKPYRYGEHKKQVVFEFVLKKDKNIEIRFYLPKRIGGVVSDRFLVDYSFYGEEETKEYDIHVSKEVLENILVDDMEDIFHFN